MMSIERELLQTALGILEDYEWGYGGDHHKSPEASILNDIRKLLAQPEQEPEPLLAETKIEWYGKGFRQGVNEFAPPKPLTEDVIYALDKEGVVENMDDHQVRYVIRWIRRVEKAHGIGGGNE
jgi:hypothetical protein